MYTDDDLDAAVQAGVFDADSVGRFRALVAGRQQTVLADEEHFRLLSGFNDIFVVIACTLLLVSVGWLGGELSGQVWLAALLVALVSLPLAEFFVRVRRMALPAILLLGSFVGGCSVAVMAAASGAGGLPEEQALGLAGLAGAVAAWGHWRRYRVPVTVAAGAAAVVLMVAAQGQQWLADSPEGLNGLLGLAGIGVFLAGMQWDRQDPQRQTRHSDVAFWLHLLAAPLLVHPLFDSLGILDGVASTTTLLAVLALYSLFAVVSLAIDRRALMVSALVYVLYAFNHLLESAGLHGDTGFGLTGLLIASGLLLLSAFWHRCRAGLLPRLSPALQRLLPPLG